MENYVAIVFDDDNKAYEGLHELWKLDSSGEIEVKGAAVVHRGRDGYMQVATKDTDEGLRTATGIGIGVLLGALAGPIGAAAGGAVGGVAGLTAEAFKADEREQALHETRFVLPRGKSVVLSEVSEDWVTPIDSMAKRLGGVVSRRSKSSVQNDQLDYSDYGEFLYPEDYVPAYATR